MRYRTVNDGTLRRALNKALTALEKDAAMITTSADAGFIIEAGTEDDPAGYQVFVKVSPYRESLLKTRPESGGLWEGVVPSKKATKEANRMRYGEVLDFLKYQLQFLDIPRAALKKEYPRGKFDQDKVQLSKTKREFKEALRVLEIATD